MRLTTCDLTATFRSCRTAAALGLSIALLSAAAGPGDTIEYAPGIGVRPGMTMPGVAPGSATASGPGSTKIGARPIFVSSKVSSRTVALNQSVRVEFTTTPRVMPGVDIAATVENALVVAAAPWRLVGTPEINEDAKTKTITIAMNLLPRRSGELTLPGIPLTWLSGSQVANFGTVAVADAIAIGQDSGPTPREVSGVAGFAWSTPLAELIGPTGTLVGSKVELSGDQARLAVRPDLVLLFRGGELCGAHLIAQGLTVDAARDSFFSRWGVPLITTQEPRSLQWVLGFTRITVRDAFPGTASASTSAAAAPAVVVELLREDIQSRLDRAHVSAKVFNVLDTPVPPTPGAADARRMAELQAEAQRVLELQRQDAQRRSGAVPATQPAPQPVR